MENVVTSGEILSFIDLLEKTKIEIPIIQRDYAQGRNENKHIRLDFLRALKNSIVEGKKIKLDFVYGEVIDDIFQPLDGQQRLTTLFLLHWYAIAKEGDISAKIIELLSKFTYETRISSRDFCNDLVKKSIEINNDKKISDKIKDANWFYLSWKQDPSISAMLNTIDDINDIFGDVADLWELLTGQKLITFHHLNLQDLGLSDDLYIKMNARGKLLTPFENFKAQIQKIIEDKSWEKDVNPIDRFDFKIDTIWTDFFWSKYEKRVDEAHIRFISTIIMNRIALEKSISDRHDSLQALNYNTDGLFLLKFIDFNTYKYIYKCYDIFSRLDRMKIDLDMISVNFWNHSSKGSVLDQISSEPSSYTQKVLFYAQTEFLMRNETFDRNVYLNWMRIIRNFVCFSNIAIIGNKRSDLVRDPDSFSSTIALIKILADGCDDIYKFLSDFNENSVSYRREQIKEEIFKAKKITQYPELQEIIWKLEDLNLFRGRISFVFDCVSKAYFETHISTKDKLEKFYNVFLNYFNNEIVAHDFNRVMLTIEVGGKYEFYGYWWSYWYAGAANKRKFISKLNEIEYYIHSEYRSYFIQLVLFLLEKDFNNIISDFQFPDDMPNWKRALIAEDDTIKNRLSDFFAITEDNSTCYLLKSQKPTSTEGSLLIS